MSEYTIGLLIFCFGPLVCHCLENLFDAILDTLDSIGKFFDRLKHYSASMSSNPTLFASRP